MPRLSSVSSAAIALLFVILTVSAAKADTINFDDIVVPPGALHPITNTEYLSRGVIIRNGSNSFGLPLFIGRSPSANTSPNYLFASINNTFVANAPIVIDFQVPGSFTPAATNFVSFFVVDPNDDPGATFTASIFDPEGNLLDTLTGTANNTQIIFSTAIPNIARLVFTPSSDGEGIDTLSFGPLTATAVPEPATLLLLGTGLAGVLAKARRRRHQD